MADEYDITQDLVDGSFDGGQTHIPNAGGGTTLEAPHGAVPVQGVSAVVPEAVKPAEGKPLDSIRDQLTNAFKVAEKPAGDAQQAVQPQGNVPPAEAPAAAPTLTQDAAGAYRRADGTFASIEEITAFQAAAASSAKAEPEYLAGMTPVEIQQLKSLPAELQQFVGRTMEGLAQDRNRFQEYGLLEQELIGPRRQAWASNGMSPVVAIHQLLTLSDFAGRDPKGFCLYFAEQNGVDLDAALDEKFAEQANMTPAERGLHQQVQALQQQLSGITGGQQQQVHQQNLANVQSFAVEKDAQGTLLRPYFADVAGKIPAIVQGIRAQSPNISPQQLLQQAYDSACWMDPAVRAKMQEAEVAKRTAANAAAAASKRNAGSSVSGAPVGDAGRVPDNANRSLRDELKYQYDAHSN